MSNLRKLSGRSAMKALAVVFIVFLSIAMAAPERNIVIHAGHLVDVGRKVLRNNVSIVIRENKIVGVEEGFIPAGQAQLIDLAGYTVLPGLIDCHKHLSMHFSSPNQYEEMVTETPVDAAFYAANNARITLLDGFTAVRDVGAEGTTHVTHSQKAKLKYTGIPRARHERLTQWNSGYI